MKSTFPNAAVLLPALLFAWLAGCSETAPEAAIRANIEAVQQALEEKDTGDVMAHVADNFIGNERLDRRELRRRVMAHFLRHKNINVLISNVEIEVDNVDAYRADMRGVVVLTGASSLLPEDGRIYKIRGVWHRRDDRWRLARLNWE